MNDELRVKKSTTPYIVGILSMMILLIVYALVVSMVSGFGYMLEQFVRYWGYITALAAGFGVQIGLYAQLKSVVRANAGKSVVATTGTTSTLAMISCCSHYLATIAPIVAVSGVVSFIAQYQTQLFWAGIVFNLLGIFYILSKLKSAKRHGS